ncbi:hypothetical protein [Leisingera sp. M523]|uniref:hypothetical protein n=1 Tax=Leisingera sp. M523 TaxID=2867013 RepID=UPI0021A2BEB0|nr:hypothetical protein [Leisingera sp. M523]UWQ29759.1 hypothetical protein K3557_04185 [Leisingera sp. M523]
MKEEQGERMPVALQSLPPLSRAEAVHWCRELPVLRYSLKQYLPSRQAPVVQAQDSLVEAALLINHRKVMTFLTRDMGMPMATRPGIAAAGSASAMTRQMKQLVRKLGWRPVRFTKPIQSACNIERGYSAKAFPGMFFICWAQESAYDEDWLKSSYRWLGPVIAHEYVHLWQAEVSGEYGLRKWHPAVWGKEGVLWLDEGVAELVREKFLDAYGYAKPERMEVLRWKARASGSRLRDLREERKNLSYVAYDLAHFAARVLAVRHGEDVVFGYWRKQGEGLSWRRAFEESFGLPVEQFEDEIGEMLGLGDARPSKETSKGKKL